MRKLIPIRRAPQDRPAGVTWVAFAALVLAGCGVGVADNNFFAPPALGDDAATGGGSSTGGLDSSISASSALSAATSEAGTETGEGTTTTDPADTGDDAQESAGDSGSSGSESGSPVDEAGVFPPGTKTWRGVYSCSQGETRLELLLTHTTTGGGLEGVLTFGPTATNPETAEGSFLVSGSHNPADGTVDVLAGEWIDRPQGWTTISLAGTFDPLTMTISGDVLASGCSMFDVELQ